MIEEHLKLDLLKFTETSGRRVFRWTLRNRFTGIDKCNRAPDAVLND